jgi:hypothetical protein
MRVQTGKRRHKTQKPLKKSYSPTFEGHEFRDFCVTLLLIDKIRRRAASLATFFHDEQKCTLTFDSHPTGDSEILDVLDFIPLSLLPTPNQPPTRPARLLCLYDKFLQCTGTCSPTYLCTEKRVRDSITQERTAVCELNSLFAPLYGCTKQFCHHMLLTTSPAIILRV